VGRSLLVFFCGVLVGVLLNESAKRVRDCIGDKDFDSVADRVAGRLDELERGIARLPAE
jgi:hypothetical protein